MYMYKKTQRSDFRSFCDSFHRTTSAATNVIVDPVLIDRLTDEKLKTLHLILEQAPMDIYSRQVHKEYKLQNHRIYNRFRDKELWLVKKGIRRELVRINHDDFALDRTIGKLKEAY